MWAARDAKLGNRLLLLMAYHHLARSDDHGLSWPSIEELMELLGVERTQVQNLRRKLVRLGFLKLEEKGNGPGEASLYRLTLPSQNPLTPVVSQSAHCGSDSVSRFHGSNTVRERDAVSRWSEQQDSESLPYGEREEKEEVLGAHPGRGSRKLDPEQVAQPAPRDDYYIKHDLVAMHGFAVLDQPLPWAIREELAEADAHEPISRERRWPERAAS